jgi:hypothetical protein
VRQGRPVLSRHGQGRLQRKPALHVEDRELFSPDRVELEELREVRMRTHMREARERLAVAEASPIEPVEVPSPVYADMSVQCPWCFAPITQTHVDDSGLLSVRFTRRTYRCEACRSTIRISSDPVKAPHVRQ